MVTVTKSYKANELFVVAASQKFDVTCTTGCIGLGEFTVGTTTKELYVSKQFVPPLDGKGELNKAPWVSPFWLVRQVRAAKDATMHLMHVPVEVAQHKIFVPMLTNQKALKSGDELTVLRWSDGVGPVTKEAKRRRGA